MKTTALVALLGLFPAAFAQSVAPSPTESYGCQPHGDHWHCEGARTATENGAATTPAAVTTVHEDHDHEHTDAAGSGAIAPSPTESVGCEPHGDHWHCSGPRTALSTVVVTTSAAAAVSTPHDHDHEHTDAAGSGSIAPSPTESVGCEPHGDHWHCSGPRTSGAEKAVSTPVTTPAASASAAATSQPATQVVNGAGLQMVPVVGLFAVAVMAI